MSKKIITVVGLTGAQGGSVADVFLEEGGWHVRGLTRDPSKPSSQAWAAKGVELVKADVNDVSTLISAFAQSTVIFGVTDFWGAAMDPKCQALAASTGRPFNEIAYDMEVQQAKNIIDAANATLETLVRFVFSTLSATKKWSKGKYTHNFHFDSKWEGVEYLKATYPALDKKTSYLQVGLYMNNWKKGLLMAVPRKQPDGTFVFNLPASGDALIPMVEARHFVKALVEVEPGKNLLGYGSLISWNKFAELWGQFHGVTCRFERVDRKVMEEAIPGVFGEELADMHEYMSEFGYDGSDPSVIHPQDVSVLLLNSIKC
ncbi:NmrA-like family domain-containing protein 1 [Colletotrichum spaethianum]|uniref:NmrA-like family domain-containing protein 1 n=1 Tax=Colletotrichum spaethianum TaxID=700344 RepID=A0AA37LGQ2_9PEZI|nr:NmrA-like family domain-containing protein 1 [Colletotrichum spaethianum]GKT46034.1 NmrA-like family domain-containing protein 1 [Colletotrichum spaethianum]